MQEHTGIGVFLSGKIFGNAFEQDVPAFISSFGAQVDDPVGAFDHVEVVLNDDDAVTFGDECIE